MLRPLSVFRSVSLVAILSLFVSFARAQSAPSNAVLQTITLPGQQSLLKWTNLSSANAAWWDERDAYYVWPTVGDGELLAIAPAFPATAGLYAYQGDFGLTIATTTPPPFPVKTAVLQLVQMRHPGYRFADHLAHHHTAHWSEGDVYGGDASDNPSGVYSYNAVLAALDDLLPGYAGGPLLTYTTATGATGTLAPVSSNLIAGPLPLSIGGFSGNFHSLAWQWDLSAVPGDVTKIFLTAPIIHSASTIGTQLDLGDTFTRVIAPYAVPPLTLAATPGDGSVSLAWPASPPAAEVTGYNIKRATVSGGSSSFIGNGPVFTTVAANHSGTTFTDTGLVNGQTCYYVVSAVNASGEGENSPEAVATPAAVPLSPLQIWRQTHFETTTPDGPAANDADPDGDGLPNLLEYALGGHPRDPASAPVPVCALLPVPASRLSLAFFRIADPGLTYAVETATDLTAPAPAWTPIWSSTGADNVDGPVTVEDVRPLADFLRRFLRLRVTPAPTPPAP